MKVLKLCLILTFCFGFSAHTQEEATHTLPGRLSAGEILLATSDDPLGNFTELQLLDPMVVGGSRSLFLNVARDGYRIRDVAVARGGQYLFTLEIQGHEDTGFIPLGESQLFRRNLETGERDIMLAGVNLVDFELSTNAERALVGYYPEDMTFADRHDLVLRKQWCVVTFTLGQNDCRTIDFDEDTYVVAFEWVSDDTLAYTLNYTEAVIVMDTGTFTVQTISLPDGLNASQIRTIPSRSDQVLVYSMPYTVDEIGRLLLLELNTRSFTDIAEIPFSGVIVEVSPDGDYAIGAGGNPSQALMIDLRNGSILQSYSTVNDMQWQSFEWVPTEPTTFVVGHVGFRGLTVMTIILEPFTNSTVNIIDDLNGKLIIVQ
jgi:hypothetical protein